MASALGCQEVTEPEATQMPAAMLLRIRSTGALAEWLKTGNSRENHSDGQLTKRVKPAECGRITT